MICRVLLTSASTYSSWYVLYAAGRPSKLRLEQGTETYPRENEYSEVRESHSLRLCRSKWTRLHSIWPRIMA